MDNSVIRKVFAMEDRLLESRKTGFSERDSSWGINISRNWLCGLSEKLLSWDAGFSESFFFFFFLETDFSECGLACKLTSQESGFSGNGPLEKLASRAMNILEIWSSRKKLTWKRYFFESGYSEKLSREAGF